jgi:DNA mismatch repair protein MutS
MAQYTPMMQQYLAIKAEVPDAFLFFRLGDFYELFFEDAVNAARELEITLTGREGGMEERIPMCGVPHHAAEGYIARLVEKGYKVAICEQVEDPAEAKGVVRREVVRIVTPGTVMDSKSLGASSNNYIAAVSAQGEAAYALTVCDISTGELYSTWLGDAFDSVVDELNVYHPSEMIGDEPVLSMLQAVPNLTMRSTSITPWSLRAPEELLQSHFGDSDLSALHEVQKQGVALLLAYLQETQKRAITHVKHIRVVEQSQFMTMDPFTRRNLELVETVRERAKKGSLLWLLDRTVTAMGGRTLRRWIEKPLLSISQIESRLEAVGRLIHDYIAREDIKKLLQEVYDLERLAARIAYGNANARDLAALKLSLKQVPQLQQACLESGSQTLHAIAGSMDDCQDMLSWIEAAISEEPPVSVREGGMIREGYHSYLDSLREANVNGKRWIAELEQQEREATGIKSLKIGFNKVFGYYLEVTKANIGTLPEGRYERKQTLANAERYVTPELKEKEALILEAEDKMVGLEYELFNELRSRIASETSRLQRLAEAIANIDALQSLAAVSAAYHYRRPAVVEEGYNLRIVEGRHPVVEAVLKEGVFIANETDLTLEGGRVLLITGPNMAGKSTYMRQVAMICVMAQIGCFVPAAEAVIPLTDRIFTRIGAADDLIGGQSTFMVEMMDIQVMTAKATSKSLVIIDELGRGTSTGEGMAIAQAVIEYLHDRIGCKTLVSTHFHELAHLQDSLNHLHNGRMAVKESGQQVTFLRKLVPGAASTSYGIYCAQIAGLPDSIIRRSYDLLNAFETRGAELEAAAARALTGIDAAESDRIEPAGTVKSDSNVRVVSSDPVQTKVIEQLSLFKDDADGTSSAPVTIKRDKDSKAQRILDDLQSLDLINMTPMQAMNLIYEWKKKL